MEPVRFAAGSVVPAAVIPATAAQPVMVQAVLPVSVNSSSAAHVPAATPPGPSEIFSSPVRQGATAASDTEAGAGGAGEEDDVGSVALAHAAAVSADGNAAAASRRSALGRPADVILHPFSIPCRAAAAAYGLALR